MFRVQEQNYGSLRNDDCANMMSSTDVADLLAVEELEDVHCCKHLEGAEKHIANLHRRATCKGRLQILVTRDDRYRRVDGCNDEYQLDAGCDIVIDEASLLRLVEVLVLGRVSLDQWLQKIHSDEEYDDA